MKTILISNATDHPDPFQLDGELTCDCKDHHEGFAAETGKFRMNHVPQNILPRRSIDIHISSRETALAIPRVRFGYRWLGDGTRLRFFVRNNELESFWVRDGTLHSLSDGDRGLAFRAIITRLAATGAYSIEFGGNGGGEVHPPPPLPPAVDEVLRRAGAWGSEQVEKTFSRVGVLMSVLLMVLVAILAYVIGGKAL